MKSQSQLNSIKRVSIIKETVSNFLNCNKNRFEDSSLTIDEVLNRTKIANILKNRLLVKRLLQKFNEGSLNLDQSSGIYAVDLQFVYKDVIVLPKYGTLVI